PVAFIFVATRGMKSISNSIFRNVKPSGSGGYSMHNKLKLVKGGSDFFDVLEQMVNAAQHVIHFQIYIFDEDSTGKRVADALGRAARRGVKVFLMVDGYASKNLSKAFIASLVDAGIH